MTKQMLHGDREITEREENLRKPTPVLDKCYKEGEILQMSIISWTEIKDLCYQNNPFSLQIGGTFLTGDVMNKMILC